MSPAPGLAWMVMQTQVFFTLLPTRGAAALQAQRRRA